MAARPSYLKQPPPEYMNKLIRISVALRGTDAERFKCRLISEGFGRGEVEKKTVLKLLESLDVRRKITPDKPDKLVAILRDIGRADLIQQEFPEFHVPEPLTVSDSDLDWLASQIFPEWESFARQQLDISENTIVRCKDVNPFNLQQQVFQTLAEWKRQQGQGATYEVLESKLKGYKDFQELVHKWNERLQGRKKQEPRVL